MKRVRCFLIPFFLLFVVFAKREISVFPRLFGGGSESIQLFLTVVWTCYYSARGVIISNTDLDPCPVPMHVILEQEHQDPVV